MLEKAYRDLQRAQDDLVRSERLTTLGKFASVIIHDLRNPLSVVKGYAELLTVSTPDAQKTPVLAAKLLSEAERINRMVEELLDYSRGQIRLNLAQCHLGDLLTRLTEQLQPVLEARKIQLVVEHAMTDPLLVDSDRLFRVLLNLADNARKAMRHGGQLTISTQRDDTMLIVTVADTGEGMGPDVRAKLFEPFFSASSSGGTGLGMLVVQNVIEAHQGTVEVESEPQVGTTVRIRLPLGGPGGW
jgi:signal transduction histidine kinase